MYYEGTDPVVWVGMSYATDRGIMLYAENESGTPCLFLATGAMIPQNWVGRRVQITISDKSLAPPFKKDPALRVKRKVSKKAKRRK